MATNDKPEEGKAPQEQMPDVGEPARVKSAGKWIIWFIVLLAAACIISFFF